jgi:hypothetical protein
LVIDIFLQLLVLLGDGASCRGKYWLRRLRSVDQADLMSTTVSEPNETETFNTGFISYRHRDKKWVIGSIERWKPIGC